MVTRTKAGSAVEHSKWVVSMAEDAVDAADRRIAKANDHLAEAERIRSDAVQALEIARAELAEWVKAAESPDSETASATAHNAAVRTESSN